MAFLTKTAPAKPVTDAARVRSGAGWFYFIGGLSVLNSIMAFAGSSMMMMFGLTSTLFATYLGIQLGGTASIVGMAATVCVALLFVGLGWMAQRGAVWAFITGLALYSVDGVVTVVLKDYLGAFVHVAGIVFIALGLLALLRTRRARAAGVDLPGAAPANGPTAPTPPIPAVPSVPPLPANLPIGFADSKAPAPLE